MKGVADFGLQLKEAEIPEAEVISEPSYFPREVWENIIQCIPWRERFQLEAVCKRWKELMPYSDVKEFIINELYSRENYASLLENAFKSVLPRCGQYLTNISVSKGIPLLVSVSSMKILQEYCVGLEKLVLKSCIIKDVDVLNHVPPTVKYLGLPGVPWQRKKSISTFGKLDGTRNSLTKHEKICNLYLQGLSELLQDKLDVLSLELKGFLPGTIIYLPRLLYLSISTTYQLHGSAFSLTSEHFEYICHNCPSLHSLKICHHSHERVTFGASVGLLVHLRSLSLKHISVTMEAVQALYSNCTDLTSIDFAGCKLLHGSEFPPLTILKSLPELAVLKFRGCFVHDAVISQMAGTGNLRKVIIEKKAVPFATMLTILQANPFLKTLKAVCSGDDLANLTDILQAGTNLQSLHLELCDFIQITIFDSTFIRPLRKLTLHRAIVHDDALWALSKICPELSKLVMKRCKQQVTVKADTPELPTGVDNGECYDSALFWELDLLPNLSVVKLYGCSVHDAAIRQMARSGNLRTVIIERPTTPFATVLAILQANPFLDTVRASCDADDLTSFTDILQAGISLRSLYLKLDGRSCGQISVLDSAFIRSLQKLSLDNVTINNYAVRALSKICPELSKLAMKRCNLVAVEANTPEVSTGVDSGGSYDVVPFVELEIAPKLSVLKLHECSVHDAVIMQMIRSGNLRQVVIEKNAIPFATILSILQANPFLDTLKAVCSGDNFENFTDILEAGLNLRSLYIELNSLIQITVLDSAFIRPLQKLTMHRVIINDDAVWTLSQLCPDLSELVLIMCELVAVKGKLPDFSKLEYH